MLVAVSRLLQEGLREADALARWGGEKFILLMPDTDLSAATVVMERIRTIAAPKTPWLKPFPVPIWRSTAARTKAATGSLR